ncbi:MAG: hypothetical protein JWN38_34 [Candidatus Saccharibacteria bacterium]|nr:hypothetical protein [Candidatus Saccharibacteria bacterium]
MTAFAHGDPNLRYTAHRARRLVAAADSRLRDLPKELLGQPPALEEVLAVAETSRQGRVVKQAALREGLHWLNTQDPYQFFDTVITERGLEDDLALQNAWGVLINRSDFLAYARSQAEDPSDTAALLNTAGNSWSGLARLEDARKRQLLGQPQPGLGFVAPIILPLAYRRPGVYNHDPYEDLDLASLDLSLRAADHYTPTTAGATERDIFGPRLGTGRIQFIRDFAAQAIAQL